MYRLGIDRKYAERVDYGFRNRIQTSDRHPPHRVGGALPVISPARNRLVFRTAAQEAWHDAYLPAPGRKRRRSNGYPAKQTLPCCPAAAKPDYVWRAVARSVLPAAALIEVVLPAVRGSAVAYWKVARAARARRADRPSRVPPGCGDDGRPLPFSAVAADRFAARYCSAVQETEVVAPPHDPAG